MLSDALLDDGGRRYKNARRPALRAAAIADAIIARASDAADRERALSRKMPAYFSRLLRCRFRRFDEQCSPPAADAQHAYMHYFAAEAARLAMGLHEGAAMS